MKKIKTYSTVLLTLLCLYSQSQTFWSEDFGTSNSARDQGKNAHGFVSANGVWKIQKVGQNDTLANNWYISSMEVSVGSGNCSSTFKDSPSNFDRSLHIGVPPIPQEPVTGNFRTSVKKNKSNQKSLIDSSASDFEAFDLGAEYATHTPIDFNSGILPSGYNITTNIRASTPVINCTNKSNISLIFDYFCGGIPGSDEFSVYYFDGSNWNLLNTFGPSVTGTCKSALWKTSDSYLLPSSANGNPNVQIGFVWKNNDDGIFSPFSVAIDNITLSGYDPTNQSANISPNAERTSNNGNKIDIITQTVADKKNNPNIVFTTYSEKFPANDLIVESSTDGTNFNELSKIKSKALKGSVGKLEYNFTDAQANDGVNYYRIKQVNTDKTTVISKIVSVDHIKAKNITFTVYPNPNSGQFTVDFSGIENNHEVQIVLNDMNDGHEIYSTTFYSNSIDSNKIDVNPPTKIAPGRYICSLIFEGIRSSVIVVIN